VWSNCLARSYTDQPPQFVILNRQEAVKPRLDAKSRMKHTIFMQLFTALRGVDPQMLKRRGQVGIELMVVIALIVWLLIPISAALLPGLEGEVRG